MSNIMSNILSDYTVNCSGKPVNKATNQIILYLLALYNLQHACSRILRNTSDKKTRDKP